MPGIPFQSKLEPLYDFIRECRAKRWSYARIARAITQDHGVRVSANGVFSFVKTRAKRPEFYALPGRDDIAAAATNHAARRPVSKELLQHASDFFTSTDSSNPEHNKMPNEKRPYRLDF